MRHTLETVVRFAFLASVFSIAFSIALGEAAMVLAMAGLLLLSVMDRRRPATPPVFWFAVAFAVLALLTGLFGLDPTRSVSKFRRLLWFAAVIPLAATLIPSRVSVRETLSAFALGAGVLSLEACVLKPALAWLDVRRGAPGAADYWTALIHRGSMTDGQMLMLGIIVCMALAHTGRESGDRRAPWGWLLALEALALIVNLKRGSWIAAALFAAVFLVVLGGRRHVLILAAAGLVVLAFPPARARLADLRGELTFQKGGRAAMWLQVGRGAIRDHPWGVGYAALSNDLMRKYAPQVERGRRHLHSNVVQVLVETGWLGLALYVAWMTRAVADAARLIRLSRGGAVFVAPACAAAVLLMLLALLVNGLVEYNFGDTELILVYAVLMGAAASSGLQPAPETAPAPARR